MHKFLKYVKKGRETEIENYDLAKADNFKGWVCHHKLGEHCYSHMELIKFGLYYNRFPHELKFMKSADHKRLHEIGNTKSLGIKLSDEQKQKISAALKGKKGHVCSEETKQKLRDYNLGNKHSKAVRKKISENTRTREVSAAYKMYKSNGGTMLWNEFQRSYNYKEKTCLFK